MTRHFVVLGIGCFCQAAFSDCTAGDPGQASALPAWGKGRLPGEVGRARCDVRRARGREGRLFWEESGDTRGQAAG